MAYSYGSGFVGAAAAGLSSLYSRLAYSEPYVPDSSHVGSSRYADADKYSSIVDRVYHGRGEGMMPSGGEIGSSGGYSAGKLPGGGGLWGGDGLGPVSPGMKRSSEALYNQTILGSHNTIGQHEDLYPTNSLMKCPRIENTSSLPTYPQRFAEKDYPYYTPAVSSKFGASRQFDHPIRVPEGGVPDLKELPLMLNFESFPERPGEPDCPYYLKTQKCGYGIRCKFNHPKDNKDTEAKGNSVFPERPSEPICHFYAKTGNCKFGANCKFHHPKDIQVPEGNGNAETESGAKGQNAVGSKPFVPLTPVVMQNSTGLPIRSGETDCPFYLKTGSCKYGTLCRFNHPEMNSAVAQSMVPSATNLPFGVINSPPRFLSNMDSRLSQFPLSDASYPRRHGEVAFEFTVPRAVYPQRPGEVPCDFYMKTGQCKYAERCRFHHPIDRFAPMTESKNAIQQNTKLTLAGLPRREDEVPCPFYMKTGACKYGPLCRYDHPPPGEAIAIAAEQAKSAAGNEAHQEAEDDDDESDDDGQQ